MNASTYIQARQRLWALRRGLDLIGSQGARRQKHYTRGPDQNLFEPLSDQARHQIAQGDGNELGSDNGKPGKMQAVHSSSALAVNVFHYWQSRGVVDVAVACGVPAAKAERIVFEKKLPIAACFQFAPNIDVVIENTDMDSERVTAIESKFGEAYCGRKHGGLDPKYLSLGEDPWRQLPRLRELAESISPIDLQYQHLHPAQLLKHILGLTRAYGRRRFRLLYLWYDVPGAEGARHREEADAFAALAKADGVRFQHQTYQELIVCLAHRSGGSHQAYVDYLSERYL